MKVTLEFYKPYLKNYTIVRKDVEYNKRNYEISKLEKKGYVVHII